VDLALVKLRSQTPGMLLRNSKTSSDYANATLRCRTDIGNAAAEMARHEDARRWHEWRNQIVNRIETRFEARYRHWQAEALEPGREGDRPRTPVSHDSAQHVGRCAFLLLNWLVNK
jgi:hypothetical protein